MGGYGEDRGVEGDVFEKSHKLGRLARVGDEQNGIILEFVSIMILVRIVCSGRDLPF